MSLTPYDTGVRLEPKPWHVQPLLLPATEEADRYGRVDFDTDEGSTALTVYVEHDKLSDSRTLHIGNVSDVVELRIAGDDSAPRIEAPSKALQGRVESILEGLRTPIEREEAEVLWSGNQAMILVAGEKHVRKQQLILVSEDGFVMSAKVGNWGTGVRDTRIG